MRKKIYRQKCSFKFKIENYPGEFNINLIDEYGWFNVHNPFQLNGVSRDHIYSIAEGFRNDIDPKIISHPANCQLLRQRDNRKKKDKCDITIEELNNKIDKWNKKYSAG